MYAVSINSRCLTRIYYLSARHRPCDARLWCRIEKTGRYASPACSWVGHTLFSECRTQVSELNDDVICVVVCTLRQARDLQKRDVCREVSIRVKHALTKATFLVLILSTSTGNGVEYALRRRSTGLAIELGTTSLNRFIRANPMIFLTNDYWWIISQLLLFSLSIPTTTGNIALISPILYS